MTTVKVSRSHKGIVIGWIISIKHSWNTSYYSPWQWALSIEKDYDTSQISGLVKKIFVSLITLLCAAGHWLCPVKSFERSTEASDIQEVKKKRYHFCTASSQQSTHNDWKCNERRSTGSNGDEDLFVSIRKTQKFRFFLVMKKLYQIDLNLNTE